MTYEEFSKTLTEEEKQIINYKFDHSLKDGSCSDWMDFSLNPQNPESIKRRLQIDAMYNCNSTCISYICRYSKLSESLIEDIIFLTSGLYSIEYDNDEYKELVCSLYRYNSKKETINKLIDILKDSENYNKIFISKVCNILDKIHKATFRTKIDWVNVLYYQKHINLSFIKKYKKDLYYIPEAQLLYQNIIKKSSVDS